MPAGTPYGRTALPTKVVDDAEYVGLAERMAQDYFKLGASHRAEQDAQSLASLIQVPDAGITGTTGYESMLQPEEDTAPTSDVSGMQESRDTSFGDTSRRTSLMAMPQSPSLPQIQPRRVSEQPSQAFELPGSEPSAPVSFTAQPGAVGSGATAIPYGAGGSAPAGGAEAPRPGDIEAYIRHAAARRGIDPDIAVRVARSEGGLEDPVRQSDVVYQGQREQSFGPLQLNVNGGVGSAALKAGIDPRNPAQWRQALDFGLDEVARSGWGQWHGAARVGIGEREGIGSYRGPPPPAPPAATQRAAEGRAASGETLQGSLDTQTITQAYQGVPYVFGGAGGRSDPRLGAATDCSGFVASVWKNQYGLPLAAHTDTSYNQLKQLGATDVAEADARPGDVVYYMGAGTGGAITHHMGIYAGPGKVLDMSVSGGDGVKTRDIGHAGRHVILRDPRVNQERPQQALAPPPIVPSADSGGERIDRTEADALSLAALTDPSMGADDVRLAQFSGGAVSDSALGMPETAPTGPPARDDYRTAVIQPYDPDQGPREATPGSVGAQPYLGPLSPNPEPVTPPAPSYAAPQPSFAPEDYSSQTIAPTPPSTYWTPTEQEQAGMGPPVGPEWLPGGVRQAAGVLSSAGQAAAAAEPASVSWLPQGSLAQQAVGSGLAVAAGPISAATDYLSARADPTGPSLVRSGILETDLSPEQYARHTELQNRRSPLTTQQGQAPLSPDEEAEYRAVQDALEARYQAIKDDPDAYMAYYHAAKGSNVLPAYLGVAAAPVLGMGAGAAATRAAGALGAGARTARAAGYVANIAAQTAVDPTTPFTQGPVDAVTAAVRAGRRAPSAVAGALADNAQRTAAADARMAASGSTTAPGVLGALPAPDPRRGVPTVEAISEQLNAARDARSRAVLTGDAVSEAAANDHMRALEEQLADAVNARRRLEPAITSDVGRRVETLPLAEETADTLSGAGARRGAMLPEELSGPVSVPPQSISLNAGFGVLPPVPRGGGPAAREAAARAAAGAPESTVGKWQALANAGVASPEQLATRLRRVPLVTTEQARSLLGERPEYLQPVAQFLLEQRQKALAGGMTARDVGKAYYQTLMSMRSTPTGVDALQAKLAHGFTMKDGTVVPPNPELARLDQMVNARDGTPLGDIFTEPNPRGGRFVRPESAGAAWLWTGDGQRALDGLSRGQFIPDAWERGRHTRLAFGSDTIGNNGALKTLTPAELAEGKVNLTNLPGFVDELNQGIAQLRTEGLEEHIGEWLTSQAQRLMGISTGKSAFVKQLLGFGDAATIDAREINYWLSGRGLPPKSLRTPRAELARATSQWWDDARVRTTLQPRIQQAVGQLQAQYPELMEGLDPTDAGHILHHWLWDRSGGTSTRHVDVMASQRLAGSAGALPPGARGPDAFAQVNRALSQGVVSSVSGGVGAQVNQELNPDDPYAGIKGFAAGALVPPLAARGGRVLARAAGAVPTPGGGALASAGGLPGPIPTRRTAPGAVPIPDGGGQGITGGIPPVPTARGAAGHVPTAAPSFLTDPMGAYAAQKARNAAEMAAAGIQPPSKFGVARGALSTIGYSSTMGPATLSVQVGTSALEAIRTVPKELIRAGTKAAVTQNPQALQEAVMAGYGVLHGFERAGRSLLDLIRARGAYAALPERPSLSMQIADPLGRAAAQILETPARIWSGGADAVFGSFAASAAEYKAAAKIATDAGKTGQPWSDHVNLLLRETERVRSSGSKQIGPQTQEVIDAGARAAERAAFRERLGPVGQKVRKLARLGMEDIAPEVGEFVTPYFNSSWNALLRLGENLPTGLVMGRGQRSGFERAYDAFTGTAIVAGATAYASQGKVTGSGPPDPEERKALQAEGWRPYHTLIGDTYYPNRMAGIFEGYLNAVGEYHDAVKYQKPDADMRMIGEDAMARIGKLIKQHPYAAGIATIIDTIEYGPAAAVSDVMSRYTPGAATARAVGTSQDPMERTTDRGKGVAFWDEVKQRYQQSIGQRSDLPVAQDILGRPQENLQQGAAVVLPKLPTRREDPSLGVLQEAGVYPGDPKREITLDEDVKLPLLPSERRVWNAARGQVVEEATRELLADPGWESAPKDVKADILQEILRYAAEAADGQVMEHIGDAEIDRRVEADQLKRRAS